MRIALTIKKVTMKKSFNIFLTALLFIILSACGERVPVTVSLNSDTGSVIGTKITLTGNIENKTRVYTKTANTIDIFFEKVVPGKYVLKVEHEDYFPIEEREIIVLTNAPAYVVNLYKNGPVRFNISANVGSAEGAIVEIKNDEGQIQTAVLQGESVFFQRLIPGDVTLEITHDDYFWFQRIGIAAIYLVGVHDITLCRRGQSNGYVFYDKGFYSDNWRYLEATPAHAEIELNWYFSQVAFAELNFNGFTDWYLPTMWELNLMYKNLRLYEFGEFRNRWYWSATTTEDNISYAWLQAFDSGVNSPGEKRIAYQARAIRKF